jgi:hypothetical protein
VVEALLERQDGGPPALEVAVVVGEEQLAGAVEALGQHVELEHVDPGVHRCLEARHGVAGGDQVGALVPDALHRWQPSHQYVGRLSSHWPFCRMRPPQRGHVRSRRA